MARKKAKTPPSAKKNHSSKSCSPTPTSAAFANDVTEKELDEDELVVQPSLAEQIQQQQLRIEEAQQELSKGIGKRRSSFYQNDPPPQPHLDKGVKQPMLQTDKAV